MISDLRAAMGSTCEMAAPKSQSRKTRFEVIGDLIAAQEGVQPGVHHLKLAEELRYAAPDVEPAARFETNRSKDLRAMFSK